MVTSLALRGHGGTKIHFCYVFEIFGYAFLLIDNSKYDEKICPSRDMTFFSYLSGHFENMTSLATAEVQISETLFFYNVGPMTFQKNIMLNFIIWCAMEFFWPHQSSTNCH